MSPQLTNRAVGLQVVMIALTVILGALVNNISTTQAQLGKDIQELKTGQATMLTRMETFTETQKTLALSVLEHHSLPGHPVVITRLDAIERRLDYRERKP